jgi:predicted metal-binding protein
MPCGIYSTDINTLRDTSHDDVGSERQENRVGPNEFGNIGYDSTGDEGMPREVKIGIIICDRYRRCSGGKCLRAMRNHEGAFSIYGDAELKLVGYTTCDGCPGGNIEYAGDEMVKNGVDVIHLATGLVVGYPPCPYIDTFKPFLEKRYGIRVVVGTHPIPAKYLDMHTQLKTWDNPESGKFTELILTDESTRKAYD